MAREYLTTEAPTRQPDPSRPALEIPNEPGSSPGSISDGPLARGVRAFEPEAVLDAGSAEPEAPPAVPVPELTAEGLLPFDMWSPMFKTAHQLPGLFLGLQSLQSAPDRPEAEPAARAIYEIIAETPSLHFLARPGGKWAERAAAIALYALPVTAAVRGEIATKRKAVAAAKATRKPAPETIAEPAPAPEPPAEMGEFFRAPAAPRGPELQLVVG
ncbi:hypothetical protein [Arenibaculum sp.]|jgi:hypothetical protein|uniref:hypothetical protein n=1 Tax=Arenibaculum sp. TaxID=2865862 RepID=UPI002E0F89C4|nr:hypothetical protein [Arenibaculum sp.]